jgi:hypothetical protein
MDTEERCVHDLIKDQCAICLHHDLGEEEEVLIFKGIIDKEQK